MELKAQVALFGLTHMLKTSKWFDVCAVQKASDVLGVRMDPQVYEMLRTLHCIRWDQIPADLWAQLRPLMFQQLGLLDPEMEIADAVISTPMYLCASTSRHAVA
jgi:hypothetical protein